MLNKYIYNFGIPNTNNFMQFKYSCRTHNSRGGQVPEWQPVEMIDRPLDVREVS